MQQLLSVWSALDVRRRVIVILATLAMFAAVLALTRAATTPQKSLLYAGLESGAAGQVVRALEQRGIIYEVRGGAIFVDASKRDELRLTLASEGLPATGGAGYELLDSLSGFGTTSQMFDAAYWRAKEGELARTIVVSPQITAARVHISNISSSPFQRNTKPTASVTVTPAGDRLSASHAKALKFLVASAVAGLTPDDVSIIDGNSGRVVQLEDQPGEVGNVSSAAAEIKQKVERLLEARVGPGNAIVEVSVERVTDRESIVERRFDPESRVAISTDTEERTTSSEDASGGSVTVASNLPEGDGGSDRNSSSQNSETRERVNFEVSETQREILRAPGAIKRLSVAVLVDGVRSIGTDGARTWAPRPEEELAALRDLVSSAVGFDEARGDVITLKSLEFEPAIEGGTAAETGLLSKVDLDVMGLVQLGVLALVSVLLGLFVVRPILAGRNIPALPLPGPGGGPGLAAESGGAQTTLTVNSTAVGAGPTGQNIMIENQIAGAPGAPANVILGSGSEAAQTVGPSGAIALETGGAIPVPGEDPVKRLRQLIEERREDTVEVLKDWMGEREERV